MFQHCRRSGIHLPRWLWCFPSRAGAIPGGQGQPWPLPHLLPVYFLTLKYHLEDKHSLVWGAGGISLVAGAGPSPQDAQHPDPTVPATYCLAGLGSGLQPHAQPMSPPCCMFHAGSCECLTHCWPLPRGQLAWLDQLGELRCRTPPCPGTHSSCQVCDATASAAPRAAWLGQSPSHSAGGAGGDPGTGAHVLYQMSARQHRKTQLLPYSHSIHRQLDRQGDGSIPCFPWLLLFLQSGITALVHPSFCVQHLARWWSHIHTSVSAWGCHCSRSWWHSGFMWHAQAHIHIHVQQHKHVNTPPYSHPCAHT